MEILEYYFGNFQIHIQLHSPSQSILEREKNAAKAVKLINSLWFPILKCIQNFYTLNPIG